MPNERASVSSAETKKEKSRASRRQEARQSTAKPSDASRKLFLTEVVAIIPDHVHRDAFSCVSPVAKILFQQSDWLRMSFRPARGRPIVRRAVTRDPVHDRFAPDLVHVVLRVVDRHPVDHQVVGRPVVDHRPVVGNPVVDCLVVQSQDVSRPVVRHRPVVGNPVVDHRVVGSPVVGRQVVDHRPVVGNPVVVHPVLGRVPVRHVVDRVSQVVRSQAHHADVRVETRLSLGVPLAVPLHDPLPWVGAAFPAGDASEDHPRGASIPASRGVGLQLPVPGTRSADPCLRGVGQNLGSFALLGRAPVRDRQDGLSVVPAVVHLVVARHPVSLDSARHDGGHRHGVLLHAVDRHGVVHRHVVHPLGVAVVRVHRRVRVRDPVALDSARPDGHPHGVPLHGMDRHCAVHRRVFLSAVVRRPIGPGGRRLEPSGFLLWPQPAGELPTIRFVT